MIGSSTEEQRPVAQGGAGGSASSQPSNAQPSNALMTRIDGPSPAVEVAVDLVRRAIIWAPIAVLGSAAFWGTDGAISATLALGLVIANFLLSAWLLQVGGRISIAAMAGAAMFGYLLRLGLILAVVLLVKDQAWLHPVAFGVVLIVSHLGLLFWELRYISGSMAYPGVKPRPGRTSAEVTVSQIDIGGQIDTAAEPSHQSSRTENPEQPTAATGRS